MAKGTISITVDDIDFWREYAKKKASVHRPCWRMWRFTSMNPATPGKGPGSVLQDP